MSNKIVILGAGFTGLLLAAEIPDAVIISDDIGGLIASNYQDGYSFDFGGHVYTPNDKRVDALMRMSGGTFHNHREAFYDVAEMVPYPVQDHASELGLTTVRDDAIKLDGTLETFFLSRFGTAFTEKFLRPFNKRVWSTDLSKMSDDWVNGRVKKPEEKPANWGMNSSFWYARGQSIIQVLEKQAITNGADILLANIIGVDTNSKMVRISKGGIVNRISYDILIDTTGLFIHERTNEVLSVGLGLIGRYQERPFHWVYPEVKSAVHRITLLSRYANDMAPYDCDSLLFEIPYMRVSGIPYWAKAIASRGRAMHPQHSVREMLIDSGYTEEQARRMPIATVWAKISRGYPIQTVGCRRRVADTKIALMEKDVYTVGRWGSHLYANLQHLFTEVESLCDLLLGRGYNDEKALRNYISSRFYYEA